MKEKIEEKNEKEGRKKKRAGKNVTITLECILSKKQAQKGHGLPRADSNHE